MNVADENILMPKRTYIYIYLSHEKLILFEQEKYIKSNFLNLNEIWRNLEKSLLNILGFVHNLSEFYLFLTGPLEIYIPNP